MDNFSLLKRLFIAAIGGVAGFFVLLLAVAIVFVVAIAAGGLSFGGGIHSWSDSLIISIFVPLLISLGAAIPAWTLGAKWWHGLIAGIIAMAFFIYIELNGFAPVDYGVFSQRETFAYISAALASVLIAIVGRNKFHLGKFVALLTFVAILAGLRLVMPGENVDEKVAVGFVVSLLAWIVLPMVAAFLTMPGHKDKSVF